MRGRDFKSNPELERIKKLARDPVELATLMYLLVEERENTNRILQNILLKLEKIEKLLEAKPKVEALSEQDKKVLELVKELGSVTARDLMKAFGYKQNSASSRLNRLVTLGYLEKKHAGRKVVFFPR
jgi:predicted HTH transcriptional regulator